MLTYTNCRYKTGVHYLKVKSTTLTVTQMLAAIDKDYAVSAYRLQKNNSVIINKNNTNIIHLLNYTRR
jgi:hypothetical protein